MEVRKMKVILIVFLLLVLLDGLFVMLVSKAAEKEEGPYFIPMEATAYCYGTTRCDGGPVREGICAAKKEWYGKTAAVYEDVGGEPGEFLGYFECLDTGGDERIKEGKVIDIYHPDYNWCKQFGRKKVLVVLFDGVG